jgi:hypothetical protein
MYRTHRLVRILTPLALVGSLAAATPLAHAASGHHNPSLAATGHNGNGPGAHLRAYGGVPAFRGSAQHTLPSFCVPLGHPKICIWPL